MHSLHFVELDLACVARVSMNDATLHRRSENAVKEDIVPYRVSASKSALLHVHLSPLYTN